MVSLRRKLPPLTALTTFEAVARLSSFTRAASELGVTQAAVSRQIHLLEETVGSPLFRRLHRRVELTEKGKALSSASTQALNLIADTLADITAQDSSNELAISATISFSHFWLLPRIASFSRAHPEIKLRIITQDKLASLDNDEVDIAIRYGNGAWLDGQAELLFHDEIFPICSIDYAQEHGPIASIEELVRHPLITNDTDDPTWTGWRDWLAEFSVKLPPKPSGMRCSFYTEAIYATLNGQGITLGWKRLVENLLNQNSLVRVTEASVATGNAYFVVLPHRRQGNAAASTFVRWLKDSSTEAI